MYTAASGMLVNLYRQDVVANNLANVNTPGFKPEMTTFQWRDPERIENNRPTEAPDAMIERLGGGVWLDRNNIDFSNGPSIETGDPLDIAIQGEGFLTLDTGRGDNNQRMRFTRDGQMTISHEGLLVHEATGMRVLDEKDRPIPLLQGGTVRIDTNGDLYQNDELVTRIRLTKLPNMNDFQKVGDNVYRVNNTSQENRQQATGMIQQGRLEGSAVNPLKTLAQMTMATSQVSANAKMLQNHDEITAMTINRFGRVG